MHPEVDQGVQLGGLWQQTSDILVREFVEAFNAMDASKLVPYLHPDVVFRNYGEDEVHGRDRLVQVGLGERFREPRTGEVRDGASGRQQ
jgi:limonene-1,2-epoxide hydrolase